MGLYRNGPGSFGYIGFQRPVSGPKEEAQLIEH